MPITIPTVDEKEKYQFLYHFIPHPKHKKRATFLSNKAFFVYSLFTALLYVVIRIIPIFAPGVLGYASDINVPELLQQTNKVRVRHGLNALKLNDSLSLAAQQKAEDMFTDDYWAHVSPSGTKPWDFIIASGYDYSYAGENLAKNFNTSEEVVDAWFNSPSHRENLLSDKYDDIGFAVVNGVLEGYETTLVVQMFGRSRVPTYTATAEIQKNLESKTPIVNEQPAHVLKDSSSAPTNEVTEFASIDLSNSAKYILLSFVSFLIALFIFDLWLSKKLGIVKFTGHTVAHLTFLIFVLSVVYIAVSPGRIL